MVLCYKARQFETDSPRLPGRRIDPRRPSQTSGRKQSWGVIPMRWSHIMFYRSSAGGWFLMLNWRKLHARIN